MLSTDFEELLSHPYDGIHGLALEAQAGLMKKVNKTVIRRFV